MCAKAKASTGSTTCEPCKAKRREQYAKGYPSKRGYQGKKVEDQPQLKEVIHPDIRFRVIRLNTVGVFIQLGNSEGIPTPVLLEFKDGERMPYHLRSLERTSDPATAFKRHAPHINI